MAIMTRRKTAAAALVVVGVAGLSIASAAQLNLKADASLGAGETVVASCQPAGDPIKVSFDNSFSGGKYNATCVVLSGIDADCEGLNYKVTVAGGGAAEATGTVTTGTTTIALTPAVAASDVTDVAVVIFD